MNPSLIDTLSEQLNQNSEQGLRRNLSEIIESGGRTVSIAGRSMTNFASNDYLGLSSHPEVKEAAIRAVEKWGTGSTSSRLVSGSIRIHHELEEAIAQWQGQEAALTFSSGFGAAVGVIPALVGPGDVVILDKRVHACCVDGAKLSGAAIRVFPHNNLGQLEDRLRWAAQSHGSLSTAGRRRRILMITESIFSMDGDPAPLTEIAALKERYGAILMVDEAHATGLFGTRRSGRIEELSLSDRVDVHFGTLSKSVGAAGGFVAGSRTLIDWLIQSARSLLFTTAPAPAAVGAAAKAIELIQSHEGRDRLNHVQRLTEPLRLHVKKRAERKFDFASNDQEVLTNASGSDTSSNVDWSGPIIPWFVGDEFTSLSESKRLKELGILAPAIRFPTVARGQARLRLSVTAHLETQDVHQLTASL